ncbi:hypothetical protein MML48_4g00020442 [Holotrichia oblita]|uniref:Uncharacterized protein n=1 Tax=Holotrichia oblita TaxID=644536 RepID=A0ACB9TAC0_HOLOL|nr:hypothetical protein MML48_4g00020442 [Holotrichia oblita]
MVGQIWDSPADITRIPTGVSYATFPNNKFLQNTLKSYAIYHLNTFNEEATKHYLKSRSAMYNNPIRTPILMFGSKKDPISTEESTLKICDYWKENGIEVEVKIWDDTEHVSHMAKYPNEYLEQLAGYLQDVGVIARYNLSTKAINKNLYLISNEKYKINPETFKVELGKCRPLAVMPTWLMANEKHINKNAKFYLDYGFDVLNIKLQMWQLLLPTKGTQVIVINMRISPLNYKLANQTYSPLVLHGFSIGGYLWGEALVQMKSDKKRYQPIADKISGQIWDSLADITQIPIGTPAAMFPNNKLLQTILRSYLVFHMKAFDKIATCHYRKSRDAFFENIVNVPMLIFGSKIDPVATEETLRTLKEHLESKGSKVYWKIWDDSPHVSHLFKYPEEYTKIMTDYLKDMKALPPKSGT